jgi:hypothetical protein
VVRVDLKVASWHIFIFSFDVKIIVNRRIGAVIIYYLLDTFTIRGGFIDA